ncbi:hypothetical protein TOPH_05623 [Tolypocladium ophioglossoides CBS 100239]|uniref:Uncharacterized protein n=1 Tax=Tolypocladium ophioglossoides (strain CBS 100239) TaxID=1163406 RepID=A0A0L0N6H1_TOLOC|nr:hypothetical protein TOPH_05623 [Tolypocladium ophioglossoides CBS 100239]
MSPVTKLRPGATAAEESWLIGSRMALKDGAGYAKPAHRSTSAASQALSTSKPPRPGNLASGTRKDGPDDQRNGSTFLEAMKNPNWRERRTDGTSSSSSTELAGAETSSLERTMARARHWLASSSADSAKVEQDNISNRKISASDRQFAVRHKIDGAACRDGCGAGPEKPGGACEPKGLCGVMRRLNIDASPSRHEGLHVIEITPNIGTWRGKASGDSGSPGRSPVVAEIQLVQVLPTETPGRGSSHGQGHGHGAAPTLCLQTYEREQRSSSATDQSTGRSIRGSISEEFEAAVKSSLAQDPIEARPAQDHGPLDDDARSTAGDGQKSNLNAKNIAFQKMLKKLKIRTAGSGSSRDDADSGYGTGSGSDPVAEEPAGHARADKQPTGGLRSFVRRDKTASDYAVSYRPAANSSHRAERSKDSGTSDYSRDRFNSLNPKAREFLSFKPDESGDAEQSKKRGLAASSCEDLNGGGGGDAGSPTDMWSGAGFEARDGAGFEARDGAGFEARDGAAPYEPVPVVYGPVPPPFPDMASLMLVQPGFGLANILGSPVNAVPCPPNWLSGANILPRPSLGGSSPYHAAGPALQSLPARFHPPAPPMTVQPLPVSAPQASAFGRPAPVPKPKVPNAWDQQAYEAYIEQRKAMEPGYAMECRLRQQRRARRTPAAK